ncbi:hypothetical protein [Methylobacterium nodulans]|uniref:Uncharacterized protein n=1 Tax=Methylobacterium nodulans (strain LMG 21967 / CNCM I-2342 / ORS 2060) TaxID=460265 RepID=B8ICM0_METNO|nr:hypothetical protein [Methylobacterium nodulans]ACL57431.1 conserved hypothetical protein [Methylobacterium nodulans ORS 2060]
MADAVDWTDPCARATALRTAYFGLLSGQHEQRIRFRNGDVDEDVWFTAPKIDLLRTELADAEAQCAARSLGKPRRFAFTAG